MEKWTAWATFPNPRKQHYLNAPFGPGCYELRNKRTSEFVFCGKGRNTAARMSSILPPPLGTGTRKNVGKRKYVKLHLAEIEYRTVAFKTVEEAEACEKLLRKNHEYLYPT